MPLPETITTERLVLTPAGVQYAQAIYELYAQDAEVTRYLTWRPHAAVEDTRSFMEFCERAWESGHHFPYVILRRDNQQLLGMVDARQAHGYALGYVLAKEFWNQGYMTEAVRGVIDAAFADEAIHRVWAVCYTENHGSARVMEKAGMQREGILRRYEHGPNLSPIPRDCICYSIVRDDL